MSITAENFQFVSDLVKQKSAITLGPGKEYLVESRLMTVARDQGQSVNEYIHTKRTALNHADTELIVEALTTNETSWFRDSLPFSALTQHIVPELYKTRTTMGALKIWSAACSTGQEPYSIAMTLKDYFEASTFSGPKPIIDITATDLNHQVLDRCRTGKYSQLEINRGLPATHLVRYFHRAGTHWEINQDIRSMVKFTKHNLLDAPPATGPFDVIFLRNVLIYFDVATKLAVLKKAHSVLRPGGFLVLGAAETTVGLDDSWIRVPVGRSSVYQKAANTL